jgi:hypothetical protein
MSRHRLLAVELVLTLAVELCAEHGVGGG